MADERRRERNGRIERCSEREREREREGEIIRNDETAAHWRGRQKCIVSKSPRDLTVDPLRKEVFPTTQI